MVLQIKGKPQYAENFKSQISCTKDHPPSSTLFLGLSQILPSVNTNTTVSM